MFQRSKLEPRPAWARYGVAVGCVVLGWLAREALTPLLGQTSLPFIFFFPAVAMAGWHGGFGPGGIATLLSAAAADWFFIEPVHSWSVNGLGQVAALGAFVIAASFIVGAMEAMHRANAQAQKELTARERAENELMRVRQQFASTLGSVRRRETTTAASAGGPFLNTDSASAAKPASRLIVTMFVAAALLLVASTIFVYRVGLIRIHAQAKMSTELLVLQQLGDFLSAMKDAETGQRGFLLMGDETYLQPYTNVRQVVQTRLASLQNLARSGELSKDRVERVSALTRQRLAIIEQTIQLRRDKGLGAALTIVRGGEGKEAMDGIRAEITQMRADEEKELGAASDRSNWAANLRTATFIGACVLNLAFLGWAFRKISREVHRREMANLESSQRRELLATTIASIGDAVIAADGDGGVVFLNEEAERLTGWKSVEASRRPLPEIFRIVNAQTRQPAENPVDKVLRLGTVVGLANHTLLLAKDGRETPIDDSAAPIRVAGGPLFGVVLVFRDVTEQRKAQQTAARLAAIVEQSGDAIFTKDLDGIVQTWNTAAERLFGYRADEIIGKSVSLLCPSDRLTEEHHMIKRLRDGKAVERFETIQVAKDGRPIPVAVSISPLRNEGGEIVGASKVIHDISDLAAAREGLLREKELLATTLASIGDAVIVTDPNGRITFLNEEAQRLTKWSDADAMGQPLPSVFRIINEQTRQPVENPVGKVLRLGGVVGLANHTILITKDGTELPIDDSAAPIRQPGGPLFGVVLVFRDFTERKRTEEALRFSEQRARAFLNNSAIIAWLKDEEGRNVFLSDNYVRRFGLRDWKNKTDFELWPRDIAEAYRKNDLEVLGHSEPIECIEQARTAEGNVSFWLNSKFWFEDDSGKKYVGGVGVDITTHKRAEVALRESEERLSGLINSAMDAVIAVDDIQRIVLFNPAAEQMFGCPAAQALGSSLDRFIPSRFRETHRQHIGKFAQTGVTGRRMGALGALSGLRSNGEEFPIEASISQMEAGGKKLFTVILRDITERKKAEERQARLAAIVENTEDAIIGKTLDGIVTSWNPGAEAIFGYSASEMIGRSIRAIVPRDCAAEEDMILGRLRAGQSTHLETFRVRKDGRRFPVSLTASPIKDISGEVLGGAKIVRDITEHMETEEKLQEAQRKHSEELEATVAERTSKLQETVNELQSVSYSIAHDMRAPLRAMGTFAQLLLEECSGGSSKAQDYGRRIVIAAKRLDNLIQDALSYTKALLQEFPLKPVQLSELVHGLIDTYPNLHSSAAEIRIEGELPNVLGNEALLTQCFANLLGNAVKFVAPGTRAQVRVWSETGNKVARIWIEDNGIGIAKQAQQRLFGMFQKLDSQYEGTGIGLAIVRKVSERMGGKVGVESEPGKGSRFWVELRLPMERQ